MFVGIDPEGLERLARTLDEVCLRIRHASTVIEYLTRRNGALQALDSSQAATRWGEAATAKLRWRAEAIEAGQTSRFNVLALLRAEFAATGLFSPDDAESGFLTWLEERVASRRRVDAATERIDDWLHQGWLDWDVTNTDLHNIRNELESLSGPELDRVIAALAPSQLERWIAEMGHSLNGFSREEKQGVFDLLAIGASGDTLHRIHEALLTSAGQRELLDYGRAIQLHTPEQTIVDFVTTAVAGDLFTQGFSTLAPGLAIESLEAENTIDGAARQFLRHPHALPWLVVDAAAAGHSPSGMVAALGRSTDGSAVSAGFVSSLALLAAPDGLSEIAIARHPDASAMRDEGSRRLSTDAQSHLLAAAGQLMAADPEAVLTHLAMTADPEGDLTAAFWHGLVSRGEAGSIATVLDELRGGDEVDLARFSARGAIEDYEYPHARNLAFAAATLNRGFTKSAAEAHGDIDAIARVAGVATSVAGLLTGGSALAESLVGTGAGWTVESHAAAVGTEIDEQLADLIDTATSRLRPADGVDLSAHQDAGNALLAWTSVYTRLLPFA